MNPELLAKLPESPPPWDLPDFLLLNRKASRNADQFVYQVCGDTVVKTYAPRTANSDLRYEWRREDRALRALEGLGFAASYGYIERPGRDAPPVVIQAKGWVSGDEICDFGDADIAPLAALLAAMHLRGVLIQDLALRNLVRRPDGGLVFIDFGMAYLFPRRGPVFHIMLGKELFKLLRDTLSMDENKFACFRLHYDAATSDSSGWWRWLTESSLHYWMRRHAWKARRRNNVR